jgi:hypothetical protein
LFGTPPESKAAATNDWYSLRARQHRGHAINQAVPPFQQNQSSTQTKLEALFEVHE